MLSKTKEAAEATKRESAREKLSIMLVDYKAEDVVKGTTLTEFFEGKLASKEIDGIIE